MVDTSKFLIMLKFHLIFILYFTSNLIYAVSGEDSLLISGLKEVFRLPEVYSAFSTSNPIMIENCERNVLVYLNFGIFQKECDSILKIDTCFVGLCQDNLFFFDPSIYAIIKDYKIRKNKLTLIIRRHSITNSSNAYVKAEFRIFSDELRISKCSIIYHNYKNIKLRTRRTKYDLLHGEKE